MKITITYCVVCDDDTGRFPENDEILDKFPVLAN